MFMCAMSTGYLICCWKAMDIYATALWKNNTTQFGQILCDARSFITDQQNKIICCSAGYTVLKLIEARSFCTAMCQP